MTPNAYPDPNHPGSTLERKVTIIVFIVVAILVAVLVGLKMHHDTPEYALEQIEAIKSEADLEAHKDYLTARGRKILALALSAANDEGVHPSFGAPTINGNTVAVAFADPKVEGRLDFKQDGGWQLDNIILTKLNGRAFYSDLSSVAEPLTALLKAMADKSPGQVMADDRYLTDKGKKVRLRMLEQNKGNGGHGENTTFDEPIMDGRVANFSVHVPSSGGEMEGCFQVVSTYDGWKFDDLVMVKVNGRTINQSVAEQIDSPLWVWFKSAFW